MYFSNTSPIKKELHAESFSNLNNAILFVFYKFLLFCFLFLLMHIPFFRHESTLHNICFIFFCTSSTTFLFFLLHLNIFSPHQIFSTEFEPLFCVRRHAHLSFKFTSPCSMFVCFSNCAYLITMFIADQFITDNLLNRSVMNIVYYERGLLERVCCEQGLLWLNLFWTGPLWTRLLWTWSAVNVVCCERGLLRTWCVMNRLDMTVIVPRLVCYERVCYEWVCYERVCYERACY